MSERELIVNADDFGASPLTNAGIVKAHEQGIVTSASLMVHGEGALDAARYARQSETLSVGLHVDLGEWVYTQGEWTSLYEHGPAEREIPRQLELFRALVGRDPSHLDSHQHVHLREPAATPMAALAERLDVPLRERGEIRYRGEFYGQTGRGEPLAGAIEATALVAIVERLEPGTTELGCHPGLDETLGSVYCLERIEEVRALCDPRVAEALRRCGVRLRAF